jgi:SAM-dependent methyltransferase
LVRGDEPGDLPTWKGDVMANVANHVWLGTDAYDAYMGRWSRRMARAFLVWLAVPKGSWWLDVGCGTGALTEAVVSGEEPVAVLGIDPSVGFLGDARGRVADPRAHFAAGDAAALPVAGEYFDVVVAGLVLNHVPKPSAAVAEMARVAHSGGVVGAYVWDYNGEMRLSRSFWEAVAATDPDAASRDPRSGYWISRPDALAAEFRAAGGLDEVEVDSVDITMRFRDFDDYWLPHVMEGPSPPQRYVRSLGEDKRVALREQLRSTLPVAADGSIELLGRAWAARGRKG